jgi:sirohydrochlorin ferrochelatase
LPGGAGNNAGSNWFSDERRKASRPLTYRILQTLVVPATAIVIFAHGSSIESANDSVRRLADNVRQRGRFDLVEAAFLEQGQPDLDAAVKGLVSKGATRIVVLPYFLTLGIHLQRDLPKLVKKLSRSHRSLDIRIAAPLEGHPGLCRILEERAFAALDHKP